MLGAILIGGGGRLVMRLLMQFDGREPSFSIGGTLEMLAYGALVGAVGGLLHIGAQLLGGSRYRNGILVGLSFFAFTVLTLPQHIASTAEPFREVMPMVLLPFGICFVAFGMAMAAIYGRSAPRI